MKDEVSPLSLYFREGLALLFALAVVFMIAFLSRRDWTALGLREGQLNVTQQTVVGIDALLLAVTNAETGQRGFLLTGEDRYLNPYRQARADIPGILKSLEKATVSRPDQAERLRSLKPLIDQKLAELAMTIELHRSKGSEAAFTAVRSDRGIALMQQIQGSCSEILVLTGARLDLFSEQARSSVAEGSLISTFGGATLFLLLLVATITIHRGAARRQALILKLQEGEERLENTAAEADAANRAKSTFLSTMSHEIRTPMNAILGYTQLMLRDPGLGTDAKTNLKIISRSGEHLLTLINDVLDMSKIEAGRTELKPVTFNLAWLADDLSAMFRLRAEAKALTFEMLCDGEPIPYVVGDEAKIRQVLINLMGNAVKFTKLGHIRLHVCLEQRKADQLWLSAQVEDTGPGLTAAEQAMLFEPFNQTSRGAQSQEGTGLGLAISRKYARLMGGDITVSSDPGKGSTFRFEAPIGRGDAGVAIRRDAPRRVSSLTAGTTAPTILVVDDQFENRDWLTKLLTSVGFSVREANNGEAAIKSWEEFSPRLVLMDVHMPVMNGLEATRRIKAAPNGKETMIVTLTASALNDDRQIIAQSGADDFLAKPCHEDELLEKLRVLLNVTYNYEDMDGSESQPFPALAALSAKKLGQLSPEVIEELRNATSSGNKKRLDKLILQVGETEDAGSAQALQELADSYQYDALTQLLEEAARR